MLLYLLDCRSPHWNLFVVVRMRDVCFADIQDMHVARTSIKQTKALLLPVFTKLFVRALFSLSRTLSLVRLAILFASLPQSRHAAGSLLKGIQAQSRSSSPCSTMPIRSQ